MIKPILDSIGLLADVLLLLAFLNTGSLFKYSLFLLGLGLWLVLVQELEGLGGGIPVKNVGELRNRWWNFEAEVENLLLAL